MEIEKPNEANDRKRTIEAIDESRVIVGHTLSTVGFQGDPQMLVIDELQFVLRPAAVTLDCGDNRRGNVIPEHHKLLSDQKNSPGALREQRSLDAHDGSESISIQYQRFEFSSLKDPTGQVPLLKVLTGVSSADEFRIDKWTLTLYYNRQLPGGPEVRANEPLAGAFLRHFASSVKHLCHFREAINHNKPLQQRFPTLIAKSPFLRLVLQVLRDQILAHLQRVDPKGFSGITTSPFALQYFLMVGTERMEGGAVKDPHLCYFPLKDEIKVLEQKKDILTKAITDELHGEEYPVGDRQPVDFIRRYPWEAARSLIGYTFVTRAARYFPDWTAEPIVQMADNNDQQLVERKIATAVMQTLREDTRHQFNIPLCANNEILGAIIINTKKIIPWDAQALPVRSARQVGWMIDSALTMDPEVNDMARKIADAEARANQVRTYKHILQSLVHHEGSYCEMLDRLILDIAQSEAPVIRAWRPLLEYTSEDRKQLVNEFQNPPVNELSSEASRVLAVAPKDIYHQVKGMSLDEIKRDLDTMARLFQAPSRFRLNTDMGPSLQRRGSLPFLKAQVLRRILGNIYRNTLTWARIRGIVDPALELFLELDDAQAATELTINAKDNCLGIDDPGFPFGRIGVQEWMDYLNDLEKKPLGERREVHGMGFLTVARYAEATNGEFSVRNWSDHGIGGVEVTIHLGLKAERT
jgi:hypothetical protein